MTYDELRDAAKQYAVESMKKNGNDSGHICLLFEVKDGKVVNMYGQINPNVDALIGDEDGSNSRIVPPEGSS